jgi:hypothetical protein
METEVREIGVRSVFGPAQKYERTPISGLPLIGIELNTWTELNHDE